MIRSIRVSNFKSLQDVTCPLGMLNIFTGLNGMGKSTFLQVLLLLVQTWERPQLLGKGLLLNGPLISLGRGKDVLCDYADNEIITFHLIWDDQAELLLECHADAVSDILTYNSNDEMRQGWNRLGEDSVHYIPSERITPQTVYPASLSSIREYDVLGQHGEYTAHYIAEYALSSLRIPGLKHPQSSSLTLLTNIDAWMGEISPNIRVCANYNQNSNTVSLGYKFNFGTNVSDEYKPQNVGFGITYVLPVVTSLLKSQPGEILIIENPETYLHPAGQSVLGRLCALAAANGVQLLIETHSDHFINGVRVAVKQKTTPVENTKIYYVEPQTGENSHKRDMQAINIDEYGRLDNLPKGFCDEWDNMLDKLLGYDEL